MSRSLALAPLLLLLLLVAPGGTAAGVGGHYVPRAGDRFAYAESAIVSTRRDPNAAANACCLRVAAGTTWKRYFSA